MRADESGVEEEPLWDPIAGRFDGPRLLRAIAVRGWSKLAFARDARINARTLYNILADGHCKAETALKILAALDAREPFAGSRVR